MKSGKSQGQGDGSQHAYTISNYQLIVLMIGATTAYGHFVFVHLAILFAGHDGWVSLLAGVVIGALILFLQMKFVLGKKGNSIILRCKDALGNWAGGGLGIVFVLYFVLVAAVTVKTVTTFMGIIYPTTPPQVFVLFELTIAVWAVRSGIEVMARTVEFLLPGLVILGIAASLLSAKDKDITQLLPILDHGMTPILKGAVVFVVMFSECIVYNMVAENVNFKDKVAKHSWIFSLIITIMFIAPVTGPILVFGEELAKRLAYPTFTEIQYIQISNVIERFDVGGVLLWTIGSFFRIAMFLYAGTKGMAQILNLSDHRTLAIPICIIAGGISISVIPSSREEVYHFLSSVYPFVAIAIGVALPVVVAFLALMRGKMQKKVA